MTARKCPANNARPSGEGEPRLAPLPFWTRLIGLDRHEDEAWGVPSRPLIRDQPGPCDGTVHDVAIHETSPFTGKGAKASEPREYDHQPLRLHSRRPFLVASDRQR